MLYHPGKIIEVVKRKGKKTEVFALLEMWDENIFTFDVSSDISTKIKKGDYVLVDYTPISEKVPVPKQIVKVILSEDEGKKVWKYYKDYFEKKDDKPKNLLIKKPEGKDSVTKFVG
ncbi:hypothetical protein CO154_02810 [Candidatus Pacearchaeota archaeon CG_4_9_14_3_um_filter_31_7]|nr:MAG: hypothetical protein AUJ10_01735 [Candidatus Pacearchaeota archaeon CG1_02_31_27]PIN92604.1 MAG: hypothetical protein COU55_00270 [Candidatus Pacearchaeota archaeon CG10_big_fil_rev_8_21_14_0_10_31_59]PIZ81213.1 MAG: hypothetical protein COX99_00520 [Candidatus Pacearchaeota archaeon CG_4_10_14_0_2_um_filter_31_10]PJA70452.1 MAG: hypothetical protein CO154_02810 [Candidatus Pacearchaeota archaeon CG_4_9_14_3_um_filter_31_7]